MTTTAEQLTQGSLRLRPSGPSAGPNPQAWKALVGNKPVSARFSLLPNTKPRMGALGTSLVIQICLAAFVVSIPLLFPQQMIPRAMYMVTEIAGPPLDIPEPPKPKPPAPPKAAKVQPPPPVEQPAPKVNVAKFFAPRIEAPKAEASPGRGGTSEGQRDLPAVEAGDGCQPACAPPRASENRNDDRRQLGGANDRE